MPTRLSWSLALSALIVTLLLIHELLPIGDTRGRSASGLSSQLNHAQNFVNALDYSGEGDDEYLIGVGKADITGPVAEINLMGYADASQLGTGLRQRLYARAFIVGSTSSDADRFVYLVLDTQSGDTAIRDGILKGLSALGAQYSMYTQQNVAVTGTHSHSGPGAWLNYLLPQITSRGFSKQSYDAIVEGTVLSIQRAHESLSPGRLSIGTTEIEDANINRSLWAYLANPDEELDKYKHSVDKTLTLLNFQRSSDSKSIGVLTWFPVHGTSMLGNNTLITGDNKGVAAYLFERSAANHKISGVAENFVAGFSQANVGDTSPNVLGAWCEDGSNNECDFQTSVCANNRSQACHGRGPFFGLDDAGTKSCFEIGRRQYEGAVSLFDSMASTSTSSSGTTSLRGPVHAAHTFHDLSNLTFPHPNGSLVRTCPAAMGYSFAAGTTDGPGAFDFKQNNSGEANANPLWASVRNFLHEPSEEQMACHAPKPILLDVGETTKPYLWTPNIVDIQLFRVGQLVIIVAPGEATTMSGRRWKAAIAETARELLSAEEETMVVLGGPANTYAHYIATEEEYGIQRYEGASTLYGPHTLNAYIHLSKELLPYLYPPQSSSPQSTNTSSPSYLTRLTDLLLPRTHSQPPTLSTLPPLNPGPSPPIHTNSSLSFITPVVYDSPGLFRHFGQVLSDVNTGAYRRGVDAVSARFVGASPRNNLRLEGSFAEVQRVVRPALGTFFDLDSEGEVSAGDVDLMTRSEANATPNNAPQYQTILTDFDWELIYRWRRVSTVLATSEVEISWEIPEDAEPGRYRLVYNGDFKRIGSGRVEGFGGISGEFVVI